MPRARNIKPAFFKNEVLIEIPIEARLLFIGLWTLADREGRLEDRPKRIKMEIFPADNFDVDLLLTHLHESGFIIRYVPAPDEHQTNTGIDNNKYIQILNFKKHQSPHIKEPKSIIPAPDEHQTNTSAAALNPESPYLIPDILNADVCGKRAHTNFKDLIFKDEYLEIATEAGLHGQLGINCWKKFKIHFEKNPPEEIITAWKKWVVGERKPPDSHEEEKPLTSEELKIQKLGAAAWRKRRKMNLDPEQSRFLEAYEKINGLVWWDSLQQWQEGKKPAK